MHAHRRSTIGLLLAAALLLAGGVVWGLAASFAESSSPTPALVAESGAPAADAGKVVLRLGGNVDSDSLNPFVGYTGLCYEVWSLNYDFLIDHDPEGNPEPGLAESWTTSEDGLTWTFKIRQGVKWHDGVPLTAKDVAFTYNYIIDTKNDNLSLYIKDIETVEATDDYTVVMKCSEPKANMLDAWIYIVPEHVWSKIEKPMSYKMTYPIIGSGPFQTVEWKKDNFTRMEKVPGYWGGEPAIDEVFFQIYQNSDSMVAELKSGTIDGAIDVPAVQYKTVDATDEFTGYKGNIFEFEYLSFNCYDSPNSLGHPVLKDMKFRQALNWAVDKQKLVDIGLSGYGRPGVSLMPANDWPAERDPSFQPSAEEAYGFDIAKANQMLEDAGYTDSDGNGIREYKGKDIKLRLWGWSQTDSSQKEAKLIAGWFEECGLKIDLSVVDDGVLNDAIYNYDADTCVYAPDYDMYLWEWWGYIDAGDTLACFQTSQIEWWNDCCWSNAEFDKLTKEQYSEMDVPTRMDMLKRMQQLMYTESPYIVLTYPDFLELNNTAKWEGWVPLMGLPWYTSLNMDSYLQLKPKAVEESSSSNTTTYVIIGVVVALVVIVVIVLLTRRGKARTEEV